MTVALVTGGSRGIGRAIVEELSSAGLSVGFTYAQNRDAADALASQLNDGNGESKARAYHADVRNFARAQEVVREVSESLGAVDVLVNNAGIRRDGALHNMDPAAWDDVIDTNLGGVFNYCRAVVSQMIRRGGVIINVSSVSGLTGLAGQVNYSASKAGVVGLTKALAKEVGRFGIRVNAIAPGLVETDMVEGMSDAAKKQLLSRIPSGRMGTAGEVAKVVRYLASDDASYITGQVFTIDGGLS